MSDVLARNGAMPEQSFGEMLPPPPDPGEALLSRVGVIEDYLELPRPRPPFQRWAPPPPRDVLANTLFTHAPLSWYGAGEAVLVRARVDEGVCTALFDYEDADTPVGLKVLHSTLMSGEPMPLAYSPKNVSDPASLAAWVASWSEPWLPYLLAEYWQEFQRTCPSPEVFQAGVRTLADACDQRGIRSGFHGQTFDIGPLQGNGGTERCKQFILPVADRFKFATWSLYITDLNDEHVEPLIDAAVNFMAKELPGLPWGITAIGVSVPYGISADDPRRTKRADILRHIYSYAPCTMLGHYSLYQGPNPIRDYYDEQVKDVLRPVVAKLKA